MTMCRPTRRTGKYAFHASAQSSSWTSLVRTGPIGRNPKAWRWPSAASTSPAAAAAVAGSRAGTYPRTVAGRLGSTRAPRPSSTRSKAGSTETPPVATRPRISLIASIASTSASTDSSSQAPASAEGVTDLVEEPAAVRADDLAGIGGIGLEQLALLLRELRGHRDIDHDVEVAAAARPSEVRHALVAEPDLRAGLGVAVDLDLLVAIDRGNGDPRAEGRLGDRDRRLVEELGPLADEGRVGRDVHGHVERPRSPAARPGLPFVGQPDLMAVVDPGRDGDPDGALALRPAIALA